MSNQIHAEMRRARADAGFSLTEVMVTILIIGLMSTIVLINVLPARDQAAAQRVSADLNQIDSALNRFNIDMGGYPTTEQGLEALVEVPEGHARADRYPEGGYLRRLSDDPWGNAYRYVRPGEDDRPYDLFSTGADGEIGGEDMDADISFWELN